jgi:hypothetical protein
VVAGSLTLGTQSTSRHPSPRSPPGLTQWVAPPSSSRPPPNVFVTGDNHGGIGLYSTHTGRLIRTLSPQHSGGPDQQGVIASNATAFFVQPTEQCGASIQSVPLSGSVSSSPVLSVPGYVALDPAPSPATSLLAWVGAICGPSITQWHLYLTDLLTGARTDLGPYTGREDDNGLSWSGNGQLLAVEAAPTIKVVQVGAPRSPGVSLRVGGRCVLTDPAFLPSPSQVAAVRTCYSSNGIQTTSDLLAFDASSGQPLARIVAAPSGETIESVSVDRLGHVLVGAVEPSFRAFTAIVRHGHFVTINGSSPTGAEW